MGVDRGITVAVPDMQQATELTAEIVTSLVHILGANGVSIVITKLQLGHFI
jgi:hypothetical protein